MYVVDESETLNRIDENFLKRCEQILNGDITNLVNDASVYLNYNSLNNFHDYYNKIFSFLNFSLNIVWRKILLVIFYLHLQTDL